MVSRIWTFMTLILFIFVNLVFFCTPVLLGVSLILYFFIIICIPDIRAGNSQVGTRPVEGEVRHLVALIQLEGLEVAELPEIPEPHCGIFGGSGEVVTILGEGNGGDGSTVPWAIKYKSSIVN